MSAQPHPTVELRPTRLGFVGVGWIGRKRLDAIVGRGDVELVCVVDSDAARRAEIARDFPQCELGSQLGTLLESDVDGVVIATPNGSHVAQAIRCLERGLAVFCEKPLATNFADTVRVLEASQRADRLLGVDYCYRHVSGMAALRERIASGDLGEVCAIELQFHNAYAPSQRWCFDREQAGGGCLLDLGTHLLDLAMWLLPRESWQLANQQRYAAGQLVTSDDTKLEDLAFVELRSDSGILVRIGCSWYAHLGCDAHIEMQVRGAKAGATWRNLGGSFYDFEMNLHRGTSGCRLGSSPDEWGPRSLTAWLERLRRNPGFDATDAESFRRSAQLIEEVYSR